MGLVVRSTQHGEGRVSVGENVGKQVRSEVNPIGGD